MKRGIKSAPLLKFCPTYPYVLSVVLATTNSSSLFSLKTIKIPLETMRKIPINEYKSGISEKIKYPTIIANIRWIYSKILQLRGEANR